MWTLGIEFVLVLLRLFILKRKHSSYSILFIKIHQYIISMLMYYNIHSLKVKSFFKKFLEPINEKILLK